MADVKDRLETVGPFWASLTSILGAACLGVVFWHVYQKTCAEDPNVLVFGKEAEYIVPMVPVSWLTIVGAGLMGAGLMIAIHVYFERLSSIAAQPKLSVWKSLVYFVVFVAFGALLLGGAYWLLMC